MGTSYIASQSVTRSIYHCYDLQLLWTYISASVDSILLSCLCRLARVGGGIVPVPSKKQDISFFSGTFAEFCV